MNSKKILFYGNVFPECFNNVNNFLKKLIPLLMERGYQIVTREGIDIQPKDNYWLDNMVLDIAIEYRDSNKFDYDSVFSYRIDNTLNPSNHDRKILTLPSSNRFQCYRELLSNVDAVISIGGKGGVYRLGLVAAATNHLFIPLSISSGKSQSLARELNDYLKDNYSNKLSEFTLDSCIQGPEIIDFVNLLKDCINQRVSKGSNVSQKQFIDFIENNPEKLKSLSIKQFFKLLTKLPISWFLSLCILVLTVIVLFVLQLVLNAK